jgi:CheY-like chemotaxis protein
MEKTRILVVEDESIIAQDIKNSLKNMGYEVVGVLTTGEEALEKILHLKPSLILMDIALQGPMDGIEAAGRIQTVTRIPVIYLTAYADEKILQRAKITEPFGYIIKPFEEKELRFAIEMAIYKHSSEEKILEQSRFVQNILESLTHPFYVIDTSDFTIKMSNKAANLGVLSNASTCYALTHRQDKPCDGSEHPCPLQIVLKTGKAATVEHVHYDKDGNARDMEVHCYPIFDSEGNIPRVIEYSLDITERKRLEKQFLASQKMESIGRLAGGVAHDFSNIMSAVLGYSEMAMMEVPDTHPAHEYLKIIQDAGEKAATLTRQLLAFSSKQMLQMKQVNLKNIIEDMSKMLDRIIGEDIVLGFKTNPEVKRVMADQGQVEQILMNLALNARDAMPGGGSLTIETDNVTIDEGPNTEFKPGQYVMLAVSDTGEGITKELQEKIFEPFFTTKKQGKGTGLGLATVYGIVKQHKGHIFVYSEPDIGTTFKIYLPIETDIKEEPPEKAYEGMPRGTETVLVVDDEPSIRRLIAFALRPLGYNVLEASTGKEALDISNATDENIDLLLTDIIMPGISGTELSDALRKQRPGIKTIFMSGYTGNTILENEIMDTGTSFIQKPLRPSMVTNRIREVLDQKEGAK